MKKQYKILLANILTFISACLTIVCLFAVQGFTVQTIISLALAGFFSYITICFFKVENILRTTKYRVDNIQNTPNNNEYTMVA